MQTHGNHSYVYSGQSALLRSEEKVGICCRNSSPLTLNIYLPLNPSPLIPVMCAVQVSVVTGSAQASLEAVVRDWAGAGDWCQVSSVQLSVDFAKFHSVPRSALRFYSVALMIFSNH